MLIDQLCAMIAEKDMPVFRIATDESGVETERVLRVANDTNNIYSISKNFTATAIGILFDRGMLKPTDLVYDILQPRYPEKFRCVDERWKTVTVAHVLTQTTGFKGMFLDLDTDDIFAYGTTDFLWKVLHEPFVSDPGTRFAYTDANYYLLSRIASAVLNEPMQNFCAREIFAPLKIQGWSWSSCPDGYAMGGTRLFLHNTDMLKFGRLYLQKGEFNGRRILSEDFVKTATSRLAQKNDNSFYGYSFWMQKEGEAFHCGGMYGQKIFIDPAHERVISWQAYDKTGVTGELLRFLYAEANR